VQGGGREEGKGSAVRIDGKVRCRVEGWEEGNGRYRDKGREEGREDGKGRYREEMQ
jgi:hypothetical protein